MSDEDKVIKLDSFVEESKTKWVVLSRDYTRLLYDPTTGLPFCSKSKFNAEIMAKEVTEVDGIPAFACRLLDATPLLAKHRYGLEVTRSTDSNQLAENVLTAILQANHKTH
jgi:hypothetical protein